MKKKHLNNENQISGKIVNAIRRFPNMRDDQIHNEYITIPQYYRTGVIYISKKKLISTQI